MTKKQLPSQTSDWVVLLLDDKPDNLEIAMLALEFHGAKVHTAMNGQEALDALALIQPNLILADLAMPKMSGWDFLKALREHPEFDTVPVIALTAYAMAGDRQKVLESGFDGYIAKPFDVSTLVDYVRQLLEG